MVRTYQKIALSTVLLCFAPSAQAGDWVTFANESHQRMISDIGIGLQDPREKDYSWGDIDQDGDIDLIVVRKLVGTNSTGYRNVLFMNEGIAEGHKINGVLVDRSNMIPGFLDVTNDRDAALADLDGDGWLDIVTATACNFCSPNAGLLPRIYMNQGSVEGVWQGFVLEQVRMPSFPEVPNFCGVAVGDVNGDGALDIYFTDYNQDMEDRLLINNGIGFFTDQTMQRISPLLTNSSFAVHAVIIDINNNGVNDIIKNSGLGPYDFKISYNDPDLEGFFPQADVQIVCTCADYFVAVDDLNNDGRLDMVEADDASDRYYLNQGNFANGKVNWDGFTLPNSGGGFDNNTVIADLDNDGWKDILIADVDVDLPSCNQRLDIHHNLGNAPNVTFQEDVGNLPTSSGGPLRGTHDIAVFDLDGDCWLDIIIGNCTGTTIWINQGPGSICKNTCVGDIDGSGTVDTSDLLAMFAAWGDQGGNGPADLNGDHTVNTVDLLLLFANWGPCE